MWMMAPFRTLWLLQRAFTLRRSGVSLRSVLDYSDTNPHTVHPGGGRHTPVISGHHRKRSRSSNEKNNPHAVAEVWRAVHPRFLRVDSKRRSNSVGNCRREATFTHALHAPSSPVECFYDTRFKTSRLWMRFYGRGTPSRGFLWFGSIKTCSYCWI